MKGFVLFASLIFVGLATKASAQLFGTRAIDFGSGTPGQVVQVNENTGHATLVTDVNPPYNYIPDADIAFRNEEAFITDCWTGGATLNFGKIDLSTGAFTSISDQNGSFSWWGLAYIPHEDLFYTVDVFNNRFLSVTPDGVITDIGFNDWQPLGLTYDSADDKIYGTDGFNIFSIDYHNGVTTYIGYVGESADSPHADIAYDPSSDTLFANFGSDLYTVNKTNAQVTLVGSNDTFGFSDISGLGFRAVPEPASMAALGLGVLALMRRRRRKA